MKRYGRGIPAFAKVTSGKGLPLRLNSPAL